MALKFRGSHDFEKNALLYEFLIHYLIFLVLQNGGR